jgi:ankyrin repeat protein
MTISTATTKAPAEMTLSSSALLDLSDLPPRSSDDERRSRLDTLRSWRQVRPTPSPSLMDHLTSHDLGTDTKTGCMPLHWMAGTGFDEAIEFVLMLAPEDDGDDDDGVAAASPPPFPPLSADQPARKPSAGRTPLHYAARNGHLSTCRLLVERFGADPRRVASGGVTPLQLAVWQNRLDVVVYLVGLLDGDDGRCGCGETAGGSSVVLERNGYDCGLAHWVGLVPRKRWGGDGDRVEDGDDDGSGVLPLARYLHRAGVSYDSSPPNCNTQGHTPAHKAAWGGNLALLRYYRDEFGVFDTVQDVAGNYCADIARMRGNVRCRGWLLEHANGRRAESLAILGLDAAGETAPDLDDVRRRFVELARESHPDGRARRRRRGGDRGDDDDDGGDGHDDGDDGVDKDSTADDFVRIRAAYEHLTNEGGMGAQSNPKYDEVKLLEDRRRIVNDVADNGDDGRGVGGDASSEVNGIAVADGGGGGDDDDDLFMARLIAVISDYGDSGFPVALIARRWNQIWPDRPFPPEYVIERTVRCGGGGNDGASANATTVIWKKVKLVKWLRWKRDRSKCTTVNFRNVDGVVLAFDRTRQGRGMAARPSSCEYEKSPAAELLQV